MIGNFYPLMYSNNLDTVDVNSIKKKIALIHLLYNTNQYPYLQWPFLNEGFRDLIFRGSSVVGLDESLKSWKKDGFNEICNFRSIYAVCFQPAAS